MEMEQVTATRPPTKDPKKQEAGRKGAAARKKKQEAILEELRQVKEELHTRKEEMLVPQDNVPEVEEPPISKDTVKNVDDESSPWMFGVAAAVIVVGIGVWTACKSRTSLQLCRNSNNSPAQDSQLNRSVDPFIMQ